MKDVAFKIHRDPYQILECALSNGWQSVDSIPLADEGTFEVITIKGLHRLARNRSRVRQSRRADGWGPERTTVVAVDTGNYLGAIAWRWPEETGKAGA